MSQWFEDENFWNNLYPFMFPEQNFAVAADEVDAILDLAGVDKGRVLDLACGPGRHATALAKRGFRVTGVDLSYALLQKARARERAAQVEVEWVQQDMRLFVRPEAFDLAISIFTSFGYFDDRRDDLKVLQNVHHSLRKGAVLVMDMMGKECLANGFLPTTSEELADGRLRVERREIVEDWTRVRNRWTIIEKGEATAFRFETTIYSGQELKDRLFEVGFGDVQLFGGLDGSAYGVDARRLVAIARK